MENNIAYLCQHHGGDGQKAALRTLESHNKNHDTGFRNFWNKHTENHNTAPASIIDLGCGPALWLKELSAVYPESRLTGFELAPYMLEHAVNLPTNVQLINDDLNNPMTELEPESVDIALANLLIHELHQPITLFNKIRGWLKPDGVFIICDMVRQPISEYLHYQYPYINNNTDDEADYAQLKDAFQQFQEHNRYHPDDLFHLLKISGFTIIESELYKNGRAIRIAVRVA